MGVAPNPTVILANARIQIGRFRQTSSRRALLDSSLRWNDGWGSLSCPGALLILGLSWGQVCRTGILVAWIPAFAGMTVGKTNLIQLRTAHPELVEGRCSLQT